VPGAVVADGGALSGRAFVRTGVVLCSPSPKVGLRP
jgi:hypothetical protein